MAAPTQSVCAPWATIADVCSPCDDYEFDVALLEDKLAIASDLLYDLSDRRWAGECEETVRPVVGRCRTRDACRCGDVAGIRLGGSPLVEITTVKIDGVELDPSEYRIDEHAELVRLADGDGVRRGWPSCQNMYLADTEVGTFSVTYVYGIAPPPGGVAAAAALGCQLAMACQPETLGACRLTDRAISVTRQGVTKALRDPSQMFPDGLTGLNEVDLWLSSIRYGKRHRPATVVVPELAAARVRRVDT